MGLRVLRLLAIGLTGLIAAGAMAAPGFEQVRADFRSSDTVLLPLTGPWQSFYKLRVGDYRVLYRLEREVQTTTIIIEFVRHRREVYK